MLTEIAPPELTEEMRDELGRHMRLSSGFATDQAADMEAAFRAALAHIENKIGLCLAPRRFSWCAGCEPTRAVRAPIAPVRELISVNRVGRDGFPEEVDLALFHLERASTRTRIVSSGPIGDNLIFLFDAGFGDDWSATPSDLRRGVLILATEYFDRRHANGERVYSAPQGVAALIRPWLPLRLNVGRGL